MSRGELDLDGFDFDLPPDRIAQAPLPERDAARLMVLDRAGSGLAHRGIRDLPELLQPGDLLVLNTTRVLAARLRGHKATGGAAEALLLGAVEDGRPAHYRALVRVGGRLRPGLELTFGAGEGCIGARVVEVADRGEVVLAFDSDRSPYEVGEAPLPPYIRRSAVDPSSKTFDLDRYQTVFARVPGAVAAPTAGLHLTDDLLAQLQARGVERAEVVLHVGLGTFRPLQPEDIDARRLHAEAYVLPEATARAVAQTRERGGRVVAVGTTSARVLETRAEASGGVRAGTGTTELFLYPGAPVRVVDALLTNFHLPRSSLLYLVAALAGRERILDAYREAIAAGYRFYSYGDAMLIV